MLVIGDLNSQHLCYDTYNIKVKEYVCENEKDVKNNLNKFKLTNSHLLSETDITKSYKKNNQVYSFHDSSKYLMLHQLYRLSAGNTYKNKYATILAEWAICRARLKFAHYDVESWCNRIETYLELSDKMKNVDDNMIRLIKSHSTALSGWVVKSYGISGKIEKFDPYNTYSKHSLYNLVSQNDSKYMSLMLNKHNFRDTEIVTEHVFNSRLSYEDKLKAVLEKLYVETINTFILPALQKTGRLPKDIFDYFLKTYMRLSTMYVSYNFVQFAIDNYYEVLDLYNEKILTEVFYNAHTNNLIKKLQK